LRLTGSSAALGAYLTIVRLFHLFFMLRFKFLKPTSLIVMVAALLRGVDDGMDILTLSIGGADGWTEGTSGVVASRIAASGKIVTIAAGNSASSQLL